jgi:cytochrome c
MSLARAAIAAAICVAAGAALAAPDLGRVATEEEVAAWDISIAPDGAGLPPGAGTARDGKVVYDEHCAACHGQGLTGGEGLADPLVGGQDSLMTRQPVKTVGSFWPYATTLFDYVRRAMPYDAPMSLSNDQVYAVSAYILAKNGIITETARMDAASLPKVEMPNATGFKSHWPEK